jgi:signal transduction histidine kinase
MRVANSNKPNRDQPTVVIIDDDAGLRVMVREALEQAGLEVEEAADGEQGLAVIESVLPDIVLLDVMMPKLDGFALCNKLRRHPKFAHLPVMMITGLEDVQSIDRAFEIGATHFLTKPINWALLSHHVRYALRNSQLEHELLESDQALRARIADLEEAQNELERQRRSLLLLTEQLRTATDQANAANQAKSEFLAAMSHELRTPLNAVIGFSEIMASEALGPIGSPKYQEFARDIFASGQHLLDLINDILDLSKIESGKAMLCEDAIEIPEVIRSVLAIVGEAANGKCVELELECPDGLPKLHADRRKLKQILINLLANAIKFTEAGGKIIIKTWCRTASGHVFQIIDTGIGIAPSDIPKALAKFGQVDSDLNRKYEGAGLGLPLTKVLVELHGGCLDLQSDIGIGTTATVRFPADRILGSISAAEQSASLEAPDPRKWRAK